MTAGWERIKEVFSEARDRSGEDRETFLRESLGEDPEALREVRSLLDADEEGDPLLEESFDSQGHLDPGAILGTTPQDPDPEHVGPYRIERLLGEGGMGRVYLAHQTEPIQRTVALKVVRSGLMGRELRGRFEAERQVLAALDHPGIAHIYDAGVDEMDRPYFAMEYVDGVPLHEFCRHHDLGIEARISLMLRVCDAVQHAHQNGIVHRDLKPTNILVTRVDGEPVTKVIDFGIAKVIARERPLSLPHSMHTEVGQLLGTPEYMSPEQVDPEGPPVDTRSDVYSLGIVLFELLTGRVPFTETEGAQRTRVGFLELQRRILRDAPPEAGLADELEWILQRALEKDREDRYATPADLAADLRRYLRSEPIDAGPQTSRYRLRKFVHRNRVPVAAAALIVILLVSGLAATTWFALAAQRERAVAESRLDQMAAVYDFLIEDLIVSPNPFENARDVKVVDILHSAAEALDESTLDNPSLESSIRFALGISMTNLAQQAEARKQLESALRLLDEAESPDPNLALNIRHHLGISLQMAGKDEEALAILTEVARERIDRQGPDDPETLDALHWKAIAHERLDFQSGLTEIRKVLAEYERVLGPEHEATQHVAFNTAEIIGRHSDHYKEAEEILRRSLAQLEPRFDSNDFRVINAKDKLALNLLRQGHQLEEAESLYRDALAGMEEIAGPEHDETLETRFNLAACLFAQEKHGEAEAITKGIWEIVQSRPDDESVDLRLSTLGLLSNTLLMHGDLDEADRLLREGLLSIGTPTGDLLRFQHATLSAHHGGVLERLGRYEEAERAYEITVAAYAEIRGPADWHTQARLRQLCRMYLETRQFAKAVPRLRASVATLMAELGPSDTGTQPSVLMLAECFRQMRQWDRAESTLVRYEQLLLNTEGYDPKIVDVVRDHLAETREAASVGG